ncbi:hypothetical protein ABIE66_001858 [Peribacillus sp. B2I2]|uniref:hypothetical protein n=1 Tax=Peribacillus sp. B2I2 TaxID=3156468 RepID=UPI003519C31B
MKKILPVHMEGLVLPVHDQIRAIFNIARQFIENGQTNPISFDLKYVISNFEK